MLPGTALAAIYQWWGSNGGGTENAPPFSQITGSVVLRTSDGVDFLTPKVILAKASPFFKNMFAISQPQTSTPEAVEHVSEVQYIPVPEHSRIIGRLIDFLLPVPPPVIAPIEELITLLETAIKYEMEYVRVQLRSQLAIVAMKDPLKVYILTGRLVCEEEMRMAAKAYLFLPASEERYLRQMEEVSAGSLVRLNQYRKACSATVASLFNIVPLSHPAVNNTTSLLQDAGYESLFGHHMTRPWFSTQAQGEPEYDKVVVLSGSYSQRRTVWAQRWWIDCMLRATEKLKCRPHPAIMTPDFFADFLVEGAAAQPAHRMLILQAMQEFQREFITAVKEALDNVRLEVSTARRN